MNCRSKARYSGIKLSPSIGWSAGSGFSKIVTAQTKALPTATGNNLSIKGDLTRRSVVGRLDPECERPELRQFDYNPIAYAKEHRAQLVVDVLTVLKAYHFAGRPNRLRPPLQSFVEWSDTVRSALIWLNQGDPVATMDRLRRNDPALASLTAALSAWNDEFREDTVTAKAVTERANAHLFVPAPGTETAMFPLRVKQFTHPGLRDALLAVAGKGDDVDPTRLGNWLGRTALDRVVNLETPDQPEKVALTKVGEKQHAASWKLEKRG